MAMVKVTQEMVDAALKDMKSRPRPTDEEIEAAVAADPDAAPIRLDVPGILDVRRQLRLTQREFAARFGIPLGTLRDWEQGKSVPDQTSRAYLRVIARDPEGTARAFAA